jgi:uncharacterized integral membrane protein
MWAVRAILIAILLIAVIAFAFNNFGPEQQVDVNLAPFFANYTDVPLITVVFWAFVAGVILALLLFVATYVNQSVLIHTSRKKIRALENEVTVLRNRPIEESAELLKGADEKNTQIDSPFSGS